MLLVFNYHVNNFVQSFYPTAKPPLACNLIRWFLTATSGTKPILVNIPLHQREKWGSTIQYGYRKWGKSCTSVFQNTRAWEQQEWNKTMRQTNTDRRKAWVWKKVKRARNKEVPTAYHYLKNTIAYNSQRMKLRNSNFLVKFDKQICEWNYIIIL